MTTHSSYKSLVKAPAFAEYQSKATGVSTTSTVTAKKSPGAFRTISEVAGDLDVQQHVLRFWETKFSQVKPLKRGGGRRYYRPEDVDLLKTIHSLLYTEGYTIKGVQKLLREQGKNKVVQNNKPADIRAVEQKNQPQPQKQAPVQPEVQTQATVQAPVAAAPAGMTVQQKQTLGLVLAELKELRTMV